jgi:hypothetical protein
VPKKADGGGRRARLQRLRVDEVAFVDRGANPDAHVVLWKRDSRQVGKQLRVETAKTNDHSHGLELPEGKVGAGRFRTSDRKKHSHVVRIARDLNPGDSVKIETESAGDPAHQHSIEILVPEVRKRGLLAKLISFFAKGDIGEWEPQSFDEVREDQRSRDVAEALDERIRALGFSVSQILHSDVEDKEGRIRESVREFSSAIDEEVADLIAGRITKHAAEGESLPTADEVVTTLETIFSTLEVETEEENAMTTNVDLSKLTEEQRETLRNLVEKASKVDAAEAKAKEAREALAKATKAEDEDGLTDEQREIFKALSPEMRKIVEPLIKVERDRHEKLEGEVVSLKKAARRNELRTIVKDYTALAVADETLVDLLEKADEAGLLDDIQTILEPANKAASRVFDIVGSESEGMGTAEQKLDKLAKDLHAAKPDDFPTYETAYDEVTKRNPELYDEAVSESQ